MKHTANIAFDALDFHDLTANAEFHSFSDGDWFFVFHNGDFFLNFLERSIADRAIKARIIFDFFSVPETLFRAYRKALEFPCEDDPSGSSSVLQAHA